MINVINYVKNNLCEVILIFILLLFGIIVFYAYKSESIINSIIAMGVPISLIFNIINWKNGNRLYKKDISNREKEYTITVLQNIIILLDIQEQMLLRYTVAVEGIEIYTFFKSEEINCSEYILKITANLSFLPQEGQELFYESQDSSMRKDLMYVDNLSYCSTKIAHHFRKFKTIFEKNLKTVIQDTNFSWNKYKWV